jgi:hypothetical protein
MLVAWNDAPPHWQFGWFRLADLEIPSELASEITANPGSTFLLTRSESFPGETQVVNITLDVDLDVLLE